jgi:hypothetical protein
VIVSDVFPYSAANESLGGRRILAPLWGFAEQADGWLKNADIVIKIRNLWRFAISVDDRYGRIYNQGIASAILDRMNAANSIPQNSSQPLKIILIGTSGGAQVALGAAPYLNRWLDTQIFVLSVGGVFSGQMASRQQNMFIISKAVRIGLKISVELYFHHAGLGRLRLRLIKPFVRGKFTVKTIGPPSP